MNDVVLATAPLGFPWTTRDPFLFCVHHDDAYPAGNEALGPAASLAGRRLGMDFEGRDGWRMYHGDVVPGFPQHPHRGFETISLVRRGLMDHSDSLGATARFGAGDVQWMTAGEGIVHAEMFPLLERDRPNPFELFQIWINLPAADKMVPPHFAMLWADDIPEHVATDATGAVTRVRVVAGRLAGLQAPPPPPRSWASRDENAVAVWTISLQAGAKWTVPLAPAGADRTLYFFRGASIRVAGRDLATHAAIAVRPQREVTLEAGPDGAELLLLQGRPIEEPVAHHGPFVMNTRRELMQAMDDYRRTRFGGWPWPSDAPVHGPDRGRFARHADGRLEEPGGARLRAVVSD